MIHSRSSHSVWHLLHIGIDRELLEVGLFKFFITLGKSLIALSVVYHLYVNLGYELWEVCGFYFAWAFPFTVLSPFIGSLFKVLKLKLKHAIAIQASGESLFWLMFPMLVKGDLFHDVLLMMPFFFWRSFCLQLSEVAYDVFMTKHIKRKKGVILAWIQIGIVLASILAPIVGAFTTMIWGIAYTSYIALFLFIIGGIVLLLTPDEKFEVKYTPKILIKDTFKPKMRPLMLGCWGYYAYDSLLWFLWPLFLILLLGDLISLSLLLSISSALAMMVAFLSGRKIDKQKDGADKVLKSGIWMSVLINLCRPFGATALGFGIIDSFNKINDQSVMTAFNTHLYTWMHRKSDEIFERAHIRWFISENSYTIPAGLCTLLLYFSDAYWMFVLIFILGALNLSFVRYMTKLKS